MRHETRKAADVDDHAFGADEERAERLAHAHDGKDVDVEEVLNFVKVHIESRNGVVTAGVVDEHVEGARGTLLDGIFEGRDGGGLVDFETEGFDA